MSAISTDITGVIPSCGCGVFKVGDFDEIEPSSDFLCKLSFQYEDDNGDLVEYVSENGDNCPDYDFEVHYYVKARPLRRIIARKVGDVLTNCSVIEDEDTEPTAHVYVHLDKPKLGKGTLMRLIMLDIPDDRMPDGSRRVVYTTEIGTIE